MIHEISRIPPLPVAKVFALIYLVLGAIFAAFAFMRGLLQENPAPYMGLWFIAPFFYAAAGFIFTFIAASTYNLVAKRFGGIQFETTERTDAQPGAPADAEKRRG